MRRGRKAPGVRAVSRRVRAFPSLVSLPSLFLQRNGPAPSPHPTHHPHHAPRHDRLRALPPPTQAQAHRVLWRRARGGRGPARGHLGGRPLFRHPGQWGGDAPALCGDVQTAGHGERGERGGGRMFLFPRSAVTDNPHPTLTFLPHRCTTCSTWGPKSTRPTRGGGLRCTGRPTWRTTTGERERREGEARGGSSGHRF